MTTFRGFNTIGQHKKFTLTDRELIKRDLLNALSIRAGTMPGRSDVGTVIWEYIFDPNDDITLNKIESEINRIVDRDGRIEIEELHIERAENTVIVELSVLILPDKDPDVFYLEFIQDTETVSITSE